MENVNYEAGSGTNRRKNRGLVITLFAVIVIQFGAVAYLLWKLQDVRIVEKTKFIQTSNEKAELQRQLDSLVAEHNKIKSQYGELSGQLREKDSLIQANAKEIQGLLSNTYELSKVKKKLDQLRNITQGYVSQIDSLYRVNSALTSENKKIKTDLTQVIDKNTQLSKDKENLDNKINSASVLIAFKVTGIGVKAKGGGKKEEVVTKAKKVEQLRVSFTILENSLAKAGSREVYVRVAGPDERVISDGSEFSYNGKRIVYTLKKEVDYQRKATEVVLYWPKKEELKTGIYNIDVFTDGILIGSGLFKLE